MQYFPCARPLSSPKEAFESKAQSALNPGNSASKFWGHRGLWASCIEFDILYNSVWDFDEDIDSL